MIIANFIERYVTADEAAGFVGVNKFTIYKWALERRVPSYKFGKSRRFRLSDLDRFVQESAC